MKAVTYKKTLSANEPAGLMDADIPAPAAPTGHDILVEVKAISVNPVDLKVQKNVKPEDGTKVLGWDASGVVLDCGEKVSLFKKGDRVFYAGALDRSGTNSQQHLVDERIVGRMPETLDFPAAAALPLTSITAWEALFDRLDVNKPVVGAANAILIIGGAGGVGSIAVQLARQKTSLTVIATASRAESQDFLKKLGAHHIIDHTKPLAAQIEALNLGKIAFVFSTTHTHHHLNDIAELIAPQGKLCLIDDPEQFNIAPFKRKSVSIHWEFMFTRSLMKTADMAEQHKLLNEVAALVDAGKIQHTMTESLSPISAENLRLAHQKIEGNHVMGKIVLAHWR